VVFVKVDETFTKTWLSRSSEVRVKVTWDLSFKNVDFQNLSPLPFFNQSKKFQRFLILDQNISNFVGWIFEFPQLSSHVTSKFAKKSTSSDINNTWYDVRGRWNIHDYMTFKVIQVRVKVRRWPQSPIGTIFYSNTPSVLNDCIHTVWNTECNNSVLIHQ